MQVDPIKLKLKPHGTKRLTLNCDVLLSTSAFKFKLRRYILELSLNGIFTFELLMRCAYVVGRRRLPLSNPEFESANGFSA